jgi:hypothetical protein
LEAILPPLCDFFVNLQKLVFEMARLLFAGAGVLLQRNFRTVREASHRVHETDVFVFADESKNVTAFVTAEAVENLAVRIDVETGTLFLMERAERGEIGPGAFQRQIRADDINDITGGADAFESGLGKNCHLQRSISHVNDRKQGIFQAQCEAAPLISHVDDRLLFLGGLLLASRGVRPGINQQHCQILFEVRAGK